ncbi:MAG: antibiotic biosynthesis monooxygenase family protein [Asticcacaulis sp.]
MTYVLIWQFRVAPEHRADFERIYAPDGDWAALFARSDGFLGTELLKDTEQPGRYVTLDRWASAGAFAAFKRLHAEAYATLDVACEGLTESETRVGAFGSN